MITFLLICEDAQLSGYYDDGVWMVRGCDGLTGKQFVGHGTDKEIGCFLNAIIDDECLDGVSAVANAVQDKWTDVPELRMIP
jgi:hypothetical protein